jgi:peptidoglycan biosynthesis protein MviN/MurJ (putative lipid II flippase)
VISVAVYLAVALRWVGPFGMLGLVLADSAKHLAHASVMLILAWRRIGSLRGLGIGQTLFKAAVASMLMSFAVLAVTGWLEGVVGGGGRTAWLAIVGGAGGTGLAVYLLAGVVLRMAELGQVFRVVRRRLAG